MAKERMFSTSVQLTGTQFDRLEAIVVKEHASSNAEIMRKAFDNYVVTKHPELLEVK